MELSDTFFKNMSLPVFESDGARLEAFDEKAIRLPSEDTDAADELPFPIVQVLEVLARIVLFVVLSRR